MSRRVGRETALQILFQVDVSRADVQSAWKYICDEFGVADEAARYGKELAEGVLLHREAIDANIERLARDWHLERMPAVDRNLLRIAIYEMKFAPDVPPNVAINEALELAKRFSGNESAKFINGILGQLVREGQATASEDIRQEERL